MVSDNALSMSEYICTTVLTIDVLAQCEEVLSPRQFSECVMGRVWFDAQGHMSAIAVELPD